MQPSVLHCFEEGAELLWPICVSCPCGTVATDLHHATDVHASCELLCFELVNQRYLVSLLHASPRVGTLCDMVEHNRTGTDLCDHLCGYSSCFSIEILRVRFGGGTLLDMNSCGRYVLSCDPSWHLHSTAARSTHYMQSLLLDTHFLSAVMEVMEAAMFMRYGPQLWRRLCN